MHNIDCLMDSTAQTITQSKEIQRAIDKTLYKITNTFCLEDDTILVTGGDIENHKETLFNCLDKLNNGNLATNLNKCHFAKDKLTWLDYEIDNKVIKSMDS